MFTPLKQKIQQGKNRIDTTKGKTHAHEPCEDKCLRVGRVYFEIFLFLSTQRSFISFQFRLLLLLFSFFDHYISFNLRITLMTWKPRNSICVFLLFITTTKENIHKRDVNKDFFFVIQETESVKQQKKKKRRRWWGEETRISIFASSFALQLMRWATISFLLLLQSMQINNFFQIIRQTFGYFIASWPTDVVVFCFIYF